MRMAGLVPGPDLVDEGEGVAGDLRDVDDLAPDGGAGAGVHAAGEPVEAGVLVGERRAAPGLHVAQVPPERRRPGAAHVPAQLLGRVAQVAHAVRRRLQKGDFGRRWGGHKAVLPDMAREGARGAAVFSGPTQGPEEGICPDERKEG